VSCGAVLARWMAVVGWQEVRDDVGPVVGSAGGASWLWEGLELRAQLLPCSVSTAMHVLVRRERVVS